MNRERRKKIDRVISQLNDAMDAVEDIKSEEEDCYECLPEGIQDSERGEAMSEAIDCLEQAIANIEEAVEQLEDAKG